MKGFLLITVLIFAFVFNNIVLNAYANPYLDTDASEYSDDYFEDGLNELPSPDKRHSLYRRSCIRRGGNCDHRPNDCCHNSSCRCNLWGSNCRCQRMGLFQKWG